MRVLIISPYLYNKEWPEFCKNKTGFGIMLNDIVTSLSCSVEVFVATYVITQGRGGQVLPHTWRDILKCIRVKDVVQGVISCIKHRLPCQARIKQIYYHANKGYLRNTIRSLRPDIVHIHGIGMRIKPFIDVCKELKIPYVITLHGMLLNADRATVYDKALEKDLIIEADLDSIPVTVVSTGVKRRMEATYLGHSSNAIHVVINGTELHGEEIQDCPEKPDLRQKYGIRDNEKIIVSIGNISVRKNQTQIVRAIRYLSEPCRAFFCGSDTADGLLQKTIEENGLQDKAYALGFLPRETVSDILNQADLCVLASNDEGFGLSVIEAYSHGVPAVMYADLDAAPDLYSEQAMIAVQDRSDERLAKAMDIALQRDWDKEAIRKYAERFSLEEMANHYIRIYKSCL